jgi:hypothetical protein
MRLRAAVREVKQEALKEETRFKEQLHVLQQENLKLRRQCDTPNARKYAFARSAGWC